LNYNFKWVFSVSESLQTPTTQKPTTPEITSTQPTLPPTTTTSAFQEAALQKQLAQVRSGGLLIDSGVKENSTSTGPVVAYYKEELKKALARLAQSEGIDDKQKAEFAGLAKELDSKSDKVDAAMVRAIKAVQRAAGMDTAGNLVIGDDKTHLVDDGIIGTRTERLLALLNGRNADLISFSEFKEVTGSRWNYTDYQNEYDTRTNYGSTVRRTTPGIEKMFQGRPRRSLMGYVLSGAEGTTDINGNLRYESHTDPGNGATNWGMFSVNSAHNPGISSAEQADTFYNKKLKDAAAEIAPKMRAAGLNPDDTLVMATYLSLYLQSPKQAKEGLAPLFGRIAAAGSTPEALREALHDAADSAINSGKWWTNKERHIRDQDRRFNAILTRIGYFQSGKISLEVQPE
jgi:hypothetical protein